MRTQHAVPRALLACSLGALGCGGAPRPEPWVSRVASVDARAHFDVRAQLAWPYRVERVAVHLDGEPQLQREAEPGQGASALDVRVPVATEGPHTVSYFVEVTGACSLLSASRWRVRVRQSRSFEVGAQQGAAVAEVFALEPTVALERQLGVDYRSQGLEPELDGRLGLYVWPACQSPRPEERLRCSLERLAQRAGRWHREECAPTFQRALEALEREGLEAGVRASASTCTQALGAPELEFGIESAQVLRPCPRAELELAVR